MNIRVNGFSIWAIIFITLVTSFFLTFIVKKVAFFINAIDEPIEKKIHKHAMPRLGGLAIFGAYLIGYMFYGTVSTQMLSVLIGGLDIILSLIMLGSTLGFLFHNFPPAKIFMGDTGSMFLGFMIAIIALLGYKVTTIQSILIPMLILFIPIFDTFMAIIRRILKREPISRPDKEHLHFQLLKMTSSPIKTVLIIYLINIIISILYVLKDNTIAIGLYIVCMLFFIFLVLKTDILFDRSKK